MTSSRLLALLRPTIAFSFAVMMSRGTFAADRYVSLTGGNNPPYENWADAATNLQDAINVASPGETIWVADGVYSVTAQVEVLKWVLIRSVNGPAATVFRRAGPTNRIFFVSNDMALVCGVTMTLGNQSPGGGVWLGGGTVSNCVIVSNAVGVNTTGGGGVYMTNGLFCWSIVQSNSIGYNAYGAGIRMTGGRAENCIIRRNSGPAAGGTEASGGGVYGSGGIVRNCLITENRLVGTTPYCRGGGVCGGTYENCTIVSNMAREGGGVYGGTLTNCIVWGNDATTGTGPEYVGGTWGFSCTFPLPAGPGNTNTDPCFAAPARQDYRLRPGSPCLNSGTNLAWSSAGLDLDGRSRRHPPGGAVDMGAYEFSPGRLTCTFDGTPLEGTGSLAVTWSSVVEGTNLDGLVYYWDFNADGFADLTGAGLGTVTGYYGLGLFSASLAVSNSVGETDRFERINWVRVSPAEMYVSLSGSHQSPFTNWAAASTNVGSAVDLAGGCSVIWIAPGTYIVQKALSIERPMSLVGAGDRRSVVLRRGDGMGRILRVAHPEALVAGLTVREGNYGPGAGILLESGVVSNCLIVSNYVGGAGLSGGGVALSGGLLCWSLIESNRSEYNAGGGGIYMSGGTVDHCIVRGNLGSRSGGTWSYSGGIYASGGIVKNSLIVDNVNTGSTPLCPGGGAYGGCYVNCTFADNQAKIGGGAHSAVLTNCIAYFNSATTATGMNYYSCSLSYSCSDPLPSGAGNISADPLFLNRPARDFRLAADSPCVNAGTNMALVESDLDLAGFRRLAGRRVDIGAYERQVTAGTVFIAR